MDRVSSKPDKKKRIHDDKKKDVGHILLGMQVQYKGGVRSRDGRDRVLGVRPRA